jgi:acetyltransferase
MRYYEINKDKTLMNVHKLNSFFNPKRIALIGISSNPNSVSGKTLSNLVSGGYRGVIYPVNPELEATMGIPCFPDVKNLPKKPDLAIIFSSPAQVPAKVRECGNAGILAIIIMSAGFKETGEEGRKLEEEIKQELKKFDGMRILGPNCLGVISPKNNLNASFAAAMPKTGKIAFISQSGALCTSVLDFALEGGIGFSHFISVGNCLDVDFADLIDFLGEDPYTQSIIVYIESISRARQFMTAARAFARQKPIIVYKAGRYAESAQAAASHTGAMVTEDSIYDAAFERAGLIRVYDIGDIFDCAALIGKNKIPKGPNLGIITNAGGPGVMATDSLLYHNGKLAELSECTLRELNENLPESWSHRNPVDVLGDARAKRISKAAQILINDPGVDALLVIVTPQAMTNPVAIANEIVKIGQSSPKLILAAWVGGLNMREGITILNNAGIPAYQTPEQAIRSFMTLVQYSINLQTLFETPRDIPCEFEYEREQMRIDFRRRIKNSHPILSEELSKQLLKAYGIPVTMPAIANSSEEALSLAKEMGYPVVLKIQSPDITHKSDVGGVILNLVSDKMVVAAFEEILSVVKFRMPEARIDGITVQPMVSKKDAVELILGIKRDNTFGTALMVGMGGTGAELFNDRCLGFPPLNERLARLMLEKLRIYPLLLGYRGSSPKNINQLIEIIIRLSYLAADYPEILELDINPLLATSAKIVAVDARVVIDHNTELTSSDSYPHLALHPYPEKYIQKKNLAGMEILLRPIKPEDEPLWLEFLGSCSKESIYSRFRFFYNWDSHEAATRYCYIDYDREIAIIAMIDEGQGSKIIGIGRLIADPDHETVEYAVLVTDSWQNKEIGSVLTDYCIEIAKKWNLRKFVAQTSTDNRRMIRMFEKRGFEVIFNSDSTVDVDLDL